MILAVGHSARDTFRMLAECGVKLESKAFSVGARIEHLQSDIDRGLYGDLAGTLTFPLGSISFPTGREIGRCIPFACAPEDW